MRIVDSHFHWWPKSVFEALCKRTSFPKASSDGRGNYSYFRQLGDNARFTLGALKFNTSGT